MRFDKIMRSGLLGAGALLAVSFAAPASAGQIVDPLHGTCGYAAPSCVDNGTITPIFNNNTPTFGFDKSPNTGTFTNFYLQVLIPNNPGGDGLSFSMNGTNTGNSSASSSLFSSTAWTSGDLTGYLGISGNLLNGAPPNPLSAWLGSTQSVDAGATGYFVYTLDFGAVTFGKLTEPQFIDSFNLPNGTVIVADVYGTTCSGGKKPKCETGYITTAQSGALFIDCTNKDCTTRQVPEPLTISLFGVGLLGMGALSRRQKARKAA